MRDERREIRDELIHSREPDNEVAVAGDVEGGDGDNGASERRQQLPVTIDVAVPIEPAAKAGATELTGVEFDVGDGQPRRSSGGGNPSMLATQGRATPSSGLNVIGLCYAYGSDADDGTAHR